MKGAKIMSMDKVFQDKKIRKKPHFERSEDERQQPDEPAPIHSLMALQDQVGNQVVQAMLAQRKSGEAFDLDKNTADQINQQRGQGQPLDSTVQEQVGGAMGQDFSDVRVHTSPESDALNQQLGAKAFTTGQDIFFQRDTYKPQSSAGQELLAHELTHVVQQGTGSVGSSGGAMKVNAPGDAYEQEADAVAQAVTGPGAKVQQAAEESPVIARQVGEDEEKTEDKVMLKAGETIQRQEKEEYTEAEETESKAEEVAPVEESTEEELKAVELKANPNIQRQNEEECEGC
jgi:hypothetical protein